jgi:hypothetical protein
MNDFDQIKLLNIIYNHVHSEIRPQTMIFKFFPFLLPPPNYQWPCVYLGLMLGSRHGHISANLALIQKLNALSFLQV